MWEYVPRRGDIIAPILDPAAALDRPERRPALVLSHDLFNRHTGLCIACPITLTGQEHPFHVAVGRLKGAPGFVMVEHVTSFDFRARRAMRVGRASLRVLDEVLSILDACVY